MSWLVYNKKALLHALATFALLFTGVVLLTLYYDFSGIDLGGLLFLMALLCCIFIAKNVFDLAKAADVSRALEQEVALDHAVTSEELYVQLYKNSPVPYLIIDTTGHCRSANTAAVRLFGMAREKVREADIFERLQQENNEHIDFVFEKFRNGIPVSDELVRIVRDDHREAWALLSLFAVTNVSGEQIGLLTLVDITKQKKAEDAKSEFVSLASHQLRTPLAGMKWSAELLQIDEPERLSERQLKYVDRLLVSIRRMATLVDDFLRVSRFELGNFQAEYTSVALPDFVGDIVEEQSQRAKQRGVSINVECDKSMSAIVSDKNLLRMIVGNLLSNAIKYSHPDSEVKITCEERPDTVVIAVSDQGIGIPVEDQDAIFSKLFRAANAVRDVPDGTGLGLYIVREAVSVLRGNVSFTSTESMGTIFTVVLPNDAEPLNTARAD